MILPNLSSTSVWPSSRRRLFSPDFGVTGARTDRPNGKGRHGPESGGRARLGIGGAVGVDRVGAGVDRVGAGTDRVGAGVGAGVGVDGRFLL